MLSEPALVTIMGDVFKYSGLTQEICGAFEAFMHHEFQRSIIERKAALGMEFLPLLQKLSLDIKYGGLCVGSKEFWEFIQYKDNAARLIEYSVSAFQPIDFKRVREWLDTADTEASELIRTLVSSKKS